MGDHLRLSATPQTVSAGYSQSHLKIVSRFSTTPWRYAKHFSIFSAVEYDYTVSFGWMSLKRLVVHLHSVVFCSCSVPVVGHNVRHTIISPMPGSSACCARLILNVNATRPRFRRIRLNPKIKGNAGRICNLWRPSLLTVQFTCMFPVFIYAWNVTWFVGF